MKKEKITHYDETNFEKSPLYKKAKRKRRREKVYGFVSLPTFICTISFLIVSALLLFVSYFVNQSNPWFSGVLVSIACGIVTGVILYFLSNLKSSKVRSLEIEQEELYTVYQAICDVIFEKSTIDTSRYLKTWDCTVKEETKRIMDKFYDLNDFFGKGYFDRFEKNEEFQSAAKKFWDLCDEYEILSDDASREQWIYSVINLLSPIKSKLEFLITKNSDKLNFSKNYIF